MCLYGFASVNSTPHGPGMVKYAVIIIIHKRSTLPTSRSFT